MNVKAILFDFDKVVVNDFTKKSAVDFRRKFKISKKDFEIAARKASKGLDQNLISEKEFFRLLVGLLKLKISPSKVEEFFKIADKKNIKTKKEVLKFIDELKRNYSVCLASNVSKGLSARLEKMKLYESFDRNKRFFSYNMHNTKPEKIFFKLILKKLKLSPSEVIFVDDRLTNVKGAQKIGINGIVYKSAKGLQKELAKYNTISG